LRREFALSVPRPGRCQPCPGTILRLAANLALGWDVKSADLYQAMDDQPTSAIHASQLALGRALRQLRHQAGLTQKELADKAEADDTYISQVETGRRDIRWSTITRLLDALDSSFAELATEIQKHHAQPGD
jgi:DNA-binding XRE family transcriptional regulator